MVYFWIIFTLLTSSTISRGIFQPCYVFNKSLPVPLGAYQMSYFDYNGSKQVFLFGGISTGDTMQSSIYKWDINQKHGWFNSISATTVSVFYSYGQNTVVIGHRAYFIGVYDGAQFADNGYIYIFDMLTETFINGYNTEGLARPTYRCVYGCVTTNDTHIFMISGRGGGVYRPYTQIYDINGNSWYDEPITLYPISLGWVKQSCVFINDILFGFGGYIHDLSYGNNGIINHFYKYTWNNKWSYLGDKPFHSYQGSIVNYKTYVYIIGGYPTTDIVDIFDIESESLVTNSSHQYSILQPVDSMASIINSDTIYIFGGGNGNTYYSTVQICDINNVVTTSPTTMSPTTSIPTTFNPTIFSPLISTLETAHPTSNPTYVPTTSPTTEVPTTMASSSSYAPTISPETNSDGEIDDVYTTSDGPYTKENLNKTDDSHYILYLLMALAGVIIICATICWIVMLFRKRKRYTKDDTDNAIKLDKSPISKQNKGAEGLSNNKGAIIKENIGDIQLMPTTYDNEGNNDKNTVTAGRWYSPEIINKKQEDDIYSDEIRGVEHIIKKEDKWKHAVIFEKTPQHEGLIHDDNNNKQKVTIGNDSAQITNGDELPKGDSDNNNNEHNST